MTWPQVAISNVRFDDVELFVILNSCAFLFMKGGGMTSLKAVQGMTFPMVLMGFALPCLVVSTSAAEVVYGPMPAPEVRARVSDWARKRDLPETVQTSIAVAWDGAASTSLDAAAVLERAIRCWSLGAPELATFLPDCQSQDPGRLSALEEHTSPSVQDPFVA
ncbi:MAG: hypothetical protein B7Z55_02975, partial [Planctomycetales bacterium 12-60-4]